MGVDQVEVRPAVFGFTELLDFEFSGGEHDLLELAVDSVSIDVGIDVGIGSEGLDLADGIVKGLPVPEAYILEQVPVLVRIEGGVEVGFEELGFGGTFEAVGFAGGVHVVLDKRALEGEFVGSDVDGVDDAGQ